VAVKNNKQTRLSTMYSWSSKEKPSNRKLLSTWSIQGAITKR